MELTRSYRVTSIDILRGIIMIIMALDHTRDYFHDTAMTADPLNVATTTPALYFTRWVTHFCAPLFVFLSGVSAYLASLKRSKNEASRFLITRGLWLMLMEVTIITLGITFNIKFHSFLLQVIWAIGSSMVLLGFISRISKRFVLVLGLIIVFGHNILDYVSLPTSGAWANVLSVLLRSPSVIPIDDSHNILALYAILPWTGVMCVGYGIGHWFEKDFSPEKRKKILFGTGLGLIVLFIVLRALNLYGNPTRWVKGEGFMYNLFTFLNTSKYPPSLQYLGMTIGPGCIALALLENVRSKFTDILSVYGKVPFFYYILHFYLLHLILTVIFFASGYTQYTDSRLFFPLYFRPLTFGYSLPVTYAIWLAVVIVLYFPCRWFSRYKATHRQWWLSYV
jgi:uncharacterized membrane protein